MFVIIPKKYSKGYLRKYLTIEGQTWDISNRGGNGINNILCKDVGIIVNSTCIFYKYSMMVMCKFQKQLQNTIGYYLKEDKFHEVRKKSNALEQFYSLPKKLSNIPI